MSTFVISNLLVTVATTIVLLFAILFQRHLIVKPTVWFLAYFHIQIQWASTFNSAAIEADMLYPWHFFLLTQIFPLVSLLLTILTFRQSSLFIWKRLGQPAANTPLLNTSEMSFLFGIWAMFIVVYFMVVPPASTGLWILLTSKDYITAMFAREDSLKLIDNQFVKYFYAYNAGFLALFAGIFAAIYALSMLKARRFTRAALAMVLYVCLLLSTALSGARAPAAIVLMGTIGAFWIRTGAPFKPVRILVAAFLVLSIPTIFTVFRSGDQLTFEAFIDRFNDLVLARAFYVPMYTGEVHSKFVQENGYLGIGGIPKLAMLVGETPIPVANLMHNVVFPGAAQSGLMNTSFVFSYYTYFGLSIIPVLLILTLILDFMLLFFKRVPDAYLLPDLVAVNVGCLSLCGSDYTTLFFSHGFIPGPITIFGMMLLFGRSKSQARPFKNFFLKNDEGGSQSLSNNLA